MRHRREFGVTMMNDLKFAFTYKCELQGATQIPTAAVQTSAPTTPPDNCYQMNILFLFAHFYPLLAPHVELNDHTIFTQVACFHLKLCKLVAYSPNSFRCGYTDPCRILNTLRHCTERFRVCFFVVGFVSGVTRMNWTSFPTVHQHPQVSKLRTIGIREHRFASRSDFRFRLAFHRECAGLRLVTCVCVCVECEYNYVVANTISMQNVQPRT